MSEQVHALIIVRHPQLPTAAAGDVVPVVEKDHRVERVLGTIWSWDLTEGVEVDDIAAGHTSAVQGAPLQWVGSGVMGQRLVRGMLSALRVAPLHDAASSSRL